METTSFALRQPPLRLRTSPDELDSTRCTRCLEPHARNNPCGQDERISQSPHFHLSTFPSSDFSSYTARIWPSTASSPSVSSSPRSASSPHTSSWPADSDSDTNSSTSLTPASSIIKVRVSKRASPQAPPALRRKISPTETSLRDIRASQQRMMLQTKESEDQLRQLYERQTLEYLGGGFASLDTLGE